MAAKNVVGLFDTSQDAQAALRDLQSSGFTGDDISFVANNQGGEYGTNDNTTGSGTTSEAGEGAGFGAVGGTVLGGLTGLLVGLGALAIPGIGPAVAAGTLATALGSTALGAGIGAAAGGLTGALVGAGIPEEDAHVYSEGVRRGGALITVRADSDEQANMAADIMDRHNVVDIDRRGTELRGGGWNRFDDNAQPYDRSSTTGYASGGDADSNISGDDYNRSSKVGTAGGAVAGAATGAAIGSAGGPVGTVIGGIAGAVTGGGVGAAGDAAGAEASDSDYTGTTGTTSTTGTAGTAYGSATDVSTTGTTGYSTTGTTGVNTNLDQTGEIKVPIVEEELLVGKREVEGGGVRVNTRVEEVPVSEQVTLREEEVEVHREPVNRPVSDADIANFQEGTFEVRERDEEAVVAKQARVVEEVHIRKDVQERTENIQDTVRRTDVDVEQLGTTRSVGTTDVNYTSDVNTTGGNLNVNTSTDEGIIERNASGLGNRIEDATNTDLDRDGDVGRRDTRNNI